MVLRGCVYIGGGAQGPGQAAVGGVVDSSPVAHCDDAHAVDGSHCV